MEACGEGEVHAGIVQAFGGGLWERTIKVGFLQERRSERRNESLMVNE